MWLAANPVGALTKAVHIYMVLTLAAATSSRWGHLESVPTQTWINIGICVVALVVIVRLWRALKKFNDFAPYFAAALAGSMIFFYWVYDRSEPKFLSPLVERLAPFFPSRGTAPREPTP